MCDGMSVRGEGSWRKSRARKTVRARGRHGRRRRETTAVGRSRRSDVGQRGRDERSTPGMVIRMRCDGRRSLC